MAGQPKRASDLARLRAGDDLAELIFERLEEGVGYSRICMETGIGKAALLDWLDDERNAERASRARARAAAALADETVEIADSSREAKLRIATRQWLAERFDRVRFGQKVEYEVKGNITHLHLQALQDVAARRRIGQAGAQSIDLVQDLVPRTLEQQLADL